MQLNVNGAVHEVGDRHATTPLLWVLRDVLGVHSVKFGCGGGFCAACTVLVDGRAVKSCQTQAGKAAGVPIVTAEALTGPVARAVRESWYQGNVVQCGYCQPGQQCSAVALLERNPSPDDAAIDTAMAGNLCRCGTYPRIRAAIHQASRSLSMAATDNSGQTQQSDSDDRADQADALPAWLRESTPAPDGGPVRAEVALDPYLSVRADGTITVSCSQVEMGQGVHTVVATLVAEELDADLAQVRVVHGANDPAAYGNPLLGGPQLTGGSTSTLVSWRRYRQAAAQARARLVAAAAAAWRVDADGIQVRAGVLTHPDGHRAGFGELAPAAAVLAAPETATPKRPGEYRLLGREGILRVDSPAKILGTAQYTIDVSWPGLLTATVLHPPVFGATLRSLDDSAARAVPGVVDVVIIGRGVAVVAQTYHDASVAARALRAEWDDTGAELRSSEQLLAEHRQRAAAAEPGAVAYTTGDVDAAMAAVVRVQETTVDLPYAAAAPMEPNNAACRRRDDGVVEIWSGTQAPDATRTAVGTALDLPADDVEVHVTYAGGGFGLRAADDQGCAVEAAEIARALDWRYPIKVQSSRQEEFTSGGLRPAAAVRIRAGLDEHGSIVTWEHRLVTQSVLGVTDGVDPLMMEGAADHPYRLPNQHIEMAEFHTGVPVLTWRGIGTVPNDFARETLLDEIAAASGTDAVELRRGLLADDRTKRVLDVALDHAGPVPPGRGRGLAVSTGFGTHSVQLVEVSDDERGRLRIERIVLAADPGIALNPDMVRSQLEGGIVFGLSAALTGQITVRGGAVVQRNFDGYPIARMRTVPDIDVLIVNSDAEPGGVGEVSVSTVAPALVNAIAALRGTRIRSLPVATSVKLSPTGGHGDLANPPSTSERKTMSDVDITATENGPYQITGPVNLHDHDGRAVEVAPGDAVYLCRCGGSANKPFCDGSHAVNDFDGTLAN